MGKNAHWTINKTMAREVGLIETLVLQHIIDLQCVWSVTEVFQSYPDMSEELGISEHAIKQAIPKLKKLGLISVQRKSVGFRNFYKVNEEEILNVMSNPHLASEVDTPRQLVDHQESVESTLESVEYDTTSELNPPLSEVETNSLSVESDIAITKNITNNTFTKNITKNSTTVSKSGSDKNIIQKTIIDVLVDANSDMNLYNQAISDYNELTVDTISEVLGWSDSVKDKHIRAIQNVNSIK